MSVDLDFDQGYCVHCGQIGVTAETIECPETRVTYKIDQGFGDWPGVHTMRRAGGSDAWVALPVSDLSTADDSPPAA